jgi:hypothetical protein
MEEKSDPRQWKKSAYGRSSECKLEKALKRSSEPSGLLAHTFTTGLPYIAPEADMLGVPKDAVDGRKNSRAIIFAGFIKPFTTKIPDK